MTFSLKPDRLELAEMISRSIEILRENEPIGGYYGCFSGGKDSLVVKQLAAEAGIDVAWHYSVTTIDPPELVRYIRREHSDVRWVRNPRWNFFTAMKTKGFPTRRARWCCREFKELSAPDGAIQLMGLRAEESARRAKAWAEVTSHKRGGLVVAPIISWSSDEVWAFIRDRGLPYCELYDEGFHRLGCVGCPMSRQERVAAFARWPRIERLWKKAFHRIWKARSGRLTRRGLPWFGDVYFADWREMWEWWLSDSSLPEPIDGPQIKLDFDTVCAEKRKKNAR